MRKIKLTITLAMILGAIGLLSGGAHSARADGGQRYLFKENLHVGQAIPGIVVNTVTITYADSNEVAELKNFCKLVFTVTEVKNGQARAGTVFVDPQSYVQQKMPGDVVTAKTPSAYAGVTVKLRFSGNDTVISDFKGNADATDTEMVNSSLYPDGDYFPDEPVAVGSTWDATAKVRRHAELLPGDQFTAQVRLDSVKTIDGKLYASMTCALAAIRHNADKSEYDQTMTSTFLVDMTAQQIVRGTTNGKETFYAAGASSNVIARDVFQWNSWIPGLAPSTQPSGKTSENSQ